MRTLSAAAQAAMDSGTFEAYIRVGLCDAQPDNFVEWIQPVSFKLSDIEAEVTFPRASMTLGDGLMFALRRGVVINGTPEYTTTTTFYVYESSIDARYITLKGHLFKPDYKTLGVNLTWQQVVEAVYLDELNPSYKIIKPTYENASHAVWSYQFYPTGRTVVFNSLKSIVSIFKQKFLVFMRHTENTFDASAVKTDIYFYQPTETRAVDYTITDLLFSFSELFEERRLLWRDDANTVHIYNPYSGAGFLPKLHNLGYIPTSGDRPTYKFHRTSGRSSKLIPNLKYETGDYITVTTYIGNISFRAKVTEIFDPKSSPAWHIIIEPLQWFSNTEGGAMPSTIEAATPYTPLNTSYFNSVLSESDNNIQAAMETLDDHEHGLDLPVPGDADQYLGGDGQWHFLPSVVNLFLSGTNSPISGYESLVIARPTGGETSSSASITGADQVLEEFALAAGSFDLITAQTMHVHIHMEKTAGTKEATCYTKLYHRTSGGTETQIGVSDVSDSIPGDPTELNHSISVTTDTPFATTDVLVLKILCSPTGAGTDPTIATYFEGNTDARIEVGAHILTSNAASDGWTAGTGTWSYSSADSPSFVISINADVTALIGVGQRIKLTQTTVKYFIVTAVGAYGGGATLVTVYGGTDYTLANAAITSPYYSNIKAPFGFPMTPAKWTVTLTDSSDRTQATPTANTWYNVGSLSLAMPIGVWKLRYQALASCTSTAAQTGSNCFVTLSTANNTQSDSDLTAIVGAVGASATWNNFVSAIKEKLMTLTSKTTYYVNIKTSNANMASITLYNSTFYPLRVELECAYL